MVEGKITWWWWWVTRKGGREWKIKWNWWQSVFQREENVKEGRTREVMQMVGARRNMFLHVPLHTHSLFWVLSIVCASKQCKVSIQLGTARVISHAVSQLKIVVGKKESPGHKKGEISRQYNFCLFVCVWVWNKVVNWILLSAKTCNGAGDTFLSKRKRKKWQ